MNSLPSILKYPNTDRSPPITTTNPNPNYHQVIYENAEDRDALLEKLKQIPFKSPGVDQIASTLTTREMELSIDLTNFMQRHPFIVHADARLSRAYRLFRTTVSYTHLTLPTILRV